jgi:hypothetical protein
MTIHVTALPRTNRRPGGHRSRLVLALALVSTISPVALAQEADPQPPTREAARGMYMGVVSCASSGCHGSPAPVANSNVLMNEYDSWLHAPGPTHVKAYEVLFNQKSAVIVGNLRLGTPPWKAKICLDCHATNVPEELQAGTVDLADGVQCESCHGPAGGWRAKHTEEGWTHADSIEAGMIDLRDIGVRTRNCLSCHLGDATKSVDHELIAAGHPILTFELDNFTESRLMPPHWKKPSEKPDPATYGLETHGVKAWAVGQIITFEEGLGQLARQARSEKWPEFSAMSCAACHHALRDGEWRQERGYEGRPGLPPWSPARWTAPRHLVATFVPKEKESLDADVEKLSGLVASMRSRDEVAALAESIAKRLSAVEREIARASWSDRTTREVMRSIAADQHTFLVGDRQTAEQGTYALVSLSTHLVRSNPRLVRSAMVSAVDELYKTLDRGRYPDELDHGAFVEALGKLDEALR